MMKWNVHYNTNQSKGSVAVEAKDKKDAMSIVRKRMPHAEVYDAKRA